MTVTKSEYHFDEKENENKKLKREKLLKRVREKEVEDVKKVLSSPEGRRFMWRLMGEAGVFRTSFTGNSETFFNEGKRSMGLLVLDEVNKANPSLFSQMQIEFINEQKILNKQLEELNV